MNLWCQQPPQLRPEDFAQLLFGRMEACPKHMSTSKKSMIERCDMDIYGLIWCNAPISKITSDIYVQIGSDAVVD